MPAFIVVLVDDAVVANVVAALPERSAHATMRVSQEDLNVNPFESIVELVARPCTVTALRSWKQVKDR